MKDLHIHTIYSDGEYDEKEILKRIINSGVKEFAICDHNTYVGSKKVYELLKNNNYDLIFHTGVELTCRLESFKEPLNMHILVRDFDYDSKEMQYLIDKYEGFKDIKLDRMIKIVKKLYNFDIPKLEIESVKANSLSIGKPHIYTILTKYMNLDREKYYKDMDALITDDLKLDVIEVINIANKIKAKVILAHPIEIMEDHNLSFNEMDELIKYLKECGLDEIETHHSKHDKYYYEEFHKMALKYNLMESEGSDYHGEKVKPGIDIGICYKR